MAAQKRAEAAAAESTACAAAGAPGAAAAEAELQQTELDVAAEESRYATPSGSTPHLDEEKTIGLGR